MKPFICKLILLLCLAGLGPVVPRAGHAATVRYQLNSETSLLYVQIHKDPTAPLARLSHDHVVRATRWAGAVHFDPADPAACRVEAEIPVAGLAADEPAMRQRVDYSELLSEAQRRQVEGSMRGPDQLDATTYPSIQVVAQQCALLEDGRWQVVATVTLRGQSKSVAVPVQVEMDAHGIQATGEFTLLHADFGFKPYSALQGAMRNGEEITFVFTVRGDAISAQLL